MRSGEPGVRREAGFTYLGLVIALAIVGLAGAATLKVDALMRRAAAEEALLEAGAAFAAALQSYADATPRGQPAQAPSLQELLRDPRFPGVRRHLRKVFFDPVTGKAEWGIVWRDPDSKRGVLAVYSLSRARPLKQANFDARFQHLENRDHLSEWKFAALGQGVSQSESTAREPQAAPFGASAPQAADIPARYAGPRAAAPGDDGGERPQQDRGAAQGEDEE